MEIALSILLFCVILIALHFKVKLEKVRSNKQELESKVKQLLIVSGEQQDNYELLLNGIQTELNTLEKQVDQFKLERDPNALFPSMERTIEECNTVANYRLIQRLYKDITNPELLR